MCVEIFFKLNYTNYDDSYDDLRTLWGVHRCSIDDLKMFSRFSHQMFTDVLKMFLDVLNMLSGHGTSKTDKF